MDPEAPPTSEVSQAPQNSTPQRPHLGIASFTIAAELGFAGHIQNQKRKPRYVWFLCPFHAFPMASAAFETQQFTRMIFGNLRKSLKRIFWGSCFSNCLSNLFVLCAHDLITLHNFQIVQSSGLLLPNYSRSSDGLACVMLQNMTWRRRLNDAAIANMK